MAQLFRDFVNAPAQITLSDSDLRVQFHKRAPNPLLLAADFPSARLPIP